MFLNPFWFWIFVSEERASEIIESKIQSLFPRGADPSSSLKRNKWGVARRGPWFMPDLSLNSVEPNACARGEGGNRRAFSLKRLSRAANLVNAEHKELRIRLRAVPLESGRQHCFDRRRSVFGEPGSVEFFPERSVFPHR